MGDRSRARQAWMDLRARWFSHFPEDFGHPLFGSTSYRWPENSGARLSAEQWASLGDTGRGDTADHATAVLTDEFGFELVLDHSIDVSGFFMFRSAHDFRLFLHPDGVLAKIELSHDHEVDTFHTWGCVDIREHGMFEAARPGYRPLNRNSADWTPRLARADFGEAAGSFGLGWLTVCTAVEWIAPWPEPVIYLLGPDLRVPEVEETVIRQRTREHTAEILQLLPNRVHTTLGSIVAGRR